MAIVFILISLVFIGGLGTSLYGFYRYESHIQFGIMSQDLKTTVNLHRKIADSTLKDVATDLILLYRDSRIPDFLLNPLGPQRSALIRYFLDMADVKGRYDQIRILSTEGQELIRVDYNNGRPQEVTRSQLQQKSNRYYITDSLCLAPGQIYVSPLDLNIEHEEIEFPFKPVLRIGTPLLDAHKTKKGVLILNYLANELFTHLKQASQGNLGSLYMLNKQGDSLMGPDPGGLWGFMLPQNKTNSFNQRYAEAWQQIRNNEKGFFQTAQGLFAFDTFYFQLPTQVSHKNVPSWKLVDVISIPVFQKSMDRLKKNILFLFLILSFILLCVSWMVADIVVARRMAQRSLLISKANAESANKAKSQFVASISHEIRTPMNAIIGMADLLGETVLDAKQTKYVKVFKSAGETLLRLINDILDMSKVEAGYLEIEHIDFDLDVILTHIQDVFAHRIKEKSLGFEIHKNFEIPKRLMGDPSRIEQILFNLVGNAVKFTNTGSIRLDVTVLTPGSEDTEKSSLLFSVADTGIGIPPDKLEMIFDRFVQTDATVTRKYGGTGLGLTISKMLVTLMGGRIWVESTLGEKTTFYFTIPLVTADQPPKKADEAANDVLDIKDMPAVRILLVEDSPENRMLIQAFLKQMPYDIDIAENGWIAVEKYISQNYDLLLMDMEMPVMDGYTATANIRAWEKEHGKKRTPIIALTAHAMAEHKKKSLDAGCSAYLSKPVKKQILLETIQNQIQDRLK